MSVLDQLPASAEVVIAGGGPSGTYLALALARWGVASLVLEPREDVDHLRPRAKTTNARTMSLFREISLADGTTLADAVRAAAPLHVSYSQHVAFCTGLAGYELRRFPGAFQLHDEATQGPYPPAPECGQQIPQPIVEEVLRSAAEENPLVTYVTGVEVRGVDLGPDSPAGRVDVVVGSAEGTEETVMLTARRLIGADGGSSVVRKSLGIRLQGTSAPRPNVNVVFRSRELRARVGLDDAVQWWVVNPETSGMIGQLTGDDVWWTIVQGCDDPGSPEAAAGLVRTLAGVGDDLDVEVLATDTWTARMLLADSYGYTESAGSVLLVGDAAHLNPPWGGHGFNTCISDAANLAWKLAAVHRGWARTDLLATYEEERRPVAARMIADAATNGKALAHDFASAELGADSEAGRRARERAHADLEVKTSEFRSEGLVLGYDYTSSSIVVPDGLPAPEVDPIVYTPAASPGCLLPHVRTAEGSSVYDVLGTHMTVFVDGELSIAAELSAELTARFATTLPEVPVRIVEMPPAAHAAWEADVLVVRPDHHVAARVPRGRVPHGEDSIELLTDDICDAVSLASGRHEQTRGACMNRNDGKDAT